MKPQDFPQLRENEHAVLYAEVETGIVLTKAGKRALPSDGAEDKYLIFPSRTDAANHSKELVASNPRWECAILDWHGEVVETHRNVEGLPEKPVATKPTSWWRRWFAKKPDD